MRTPGAAWASTIYAGTNAGVFVSPDGGASWTTMNVGLTNPAVTAFAVGPGPGGALYIATNGAGFYVLSSELVTPGARRHEWRPSLSASR